MTIKKPQYPSLTRRGFTAVFAEELRAAFRPLRASH